MRVKLSVFEKLLCILLSTNAIYVGRISGKEKAKMWKITGLFFVKSKCSTHTPQNPWHQQVRHLNLSTSGWIQVHFQLHILVLSLDLGTSSRILVFPQLDFSSATLNFGMQMV